jgi:malonate-semialdehyde dehydrogenase (acetylating)/methylmalonate-semialdehyde dehydrogenase
LGTRHINDQVWDFAMTNVGTNTRSITSVVGGKPRSGSRLISVYDPSNGRTIAELMLADADMAKSAVGIAKAAFPAWRDTPPAQRARILMNFRELLERDKNELAELITLEHGKPHADALGSIQRGVEVVEFAIGAPHLLKGENSHQVAASVSTRSSRRPLGVCVGITPFNYPAMIPMWMFPMALVCGNSFILKPSEKTPTAANYIAELLARAGLPDGVFNVVHGGPDVVEALITHPDVSAVSFVGSSAVAKHVYETGTKAGKRVQALGGAKNHAIVMPDADMESAATAIMNGAFNSAGQRCMAISVVVTVGEAHERLMPLMVNKANALKVSAGSEADCYVPPLSSVEHKQKVLQYIDAGVAEGARIAVDRRAPENIGNSGGYFVGPVIFDDVRPEMSIYREEVFGPVLSVMRAEDLSSAIDASNAHDLGNGAVIFTSSGASAQKFEREILCGMPGINVPVPSPVAYYSFGGAKGSIFGDLAAHGPDGIRFYTRAQVLSARW